MKIYQDARRQKQAETIKGAGNPNWKGGRILKQCVRCGSPFYVYPSGTTHNHCSLACANRDLADAQRGIPNKAKGRSGQSNALYRKGYMRRGGNNTNWKGEHSLTKRNGLLRVSIAFQEWRIQVFNRDNFTCGHCGKHGGDLQAHHIKPFAEYPELRFDIANGLTLCITCHRKTFRRQ